MDQHSFGIITLFITFHLFLSFFACVRFPATPIGAFQQLFVRYIDFIYVPKTLILAYQGICYCQTWMEFLYYITNKSNVSYLSYMAYVPYCFITNFPEYFFPLRQNCNEPILYSVKASAGLKTRLKVNLGASEKGFFL